MLKIKVLGSGCYNCYVLEQTVAGALEILMGEDDSIQATMQHVEDPMEIAQYPILFTPGLVVNEKLVCAGRIPKEEEIIEWLRAGLERQAVS
ncbi:MAG: thioredoxin family protein [Anaerolineales bacterium]|nr:thioredoxin family protein [Anaerolineales bacterium]